MRWYHLFGLFLLTACEGSWSEAEQQKMLEKCETYYVERLSDRIDTDEASAKSIAKQICPCILEQQMEAYSSPAVYKYDSTEYAGWEERCFEKIDY